MGSNALEHEGVKSFRHTATDLERAEELGIEGMGAGPEWTESLRIRVQFQKLQRRAHELLDGLDRKELTVGEMLSMVQDMAEVDADYDPDGGDLH